jgi:hypothetical protein
LSAVKIEFVYVPAELSRNSINALVLPEVVFDEPEPMYVTFETVGFE